jgi:uncharacterized membrane protein YfcA
MSFGERKHDNSRRIENVERHTCCYNDFVWSQSVLNLVEIAINLYALSLLSRSKFKQAAVTALVVCAMTSSKTILYHVMEVSCGFCNTKHNSWSTFIALYLFPNGVWIWVPILACIHLGKALAKK